MSDSPLIVPGGTRLSVAEEQALNKLLERYGGVERGMPVYKIGWAMEDNHSTYDSETNSYKFDPFKRTPICFHQNQASYHILVWEPPSVALLSYEHELKGEPHVEKGTYNCIHHFVDPESGASIRPTASLIEIIIPVIKEFNEIAYAARRGFEATLGKLRVQKVERIKKLEQDEQKRYESFADDLLNDAKPAFEGNATSFPSRRPTDLFDASKETSPNLNNPWKKKQEGPIRQPSQFVFSSHVPKPQK